MTFESCPAIKLTSRARITAVGGYVPSRRLTNLDLEQMVETSDDWITQRTGIKERRIVDENIYTSDLAVKAALDLKERYDQDFSDVDLVILTTFTPDYYAPCIAGVVHGKLGLPLSAGVMDLNVACSGFVYGVQIANGLITAGQNKKILVISSEAMSKIVDYKDRNTCILFGDGAGAILVERDDENPGFLGSYVGADGSLADKIYCTGLSDQINGEVLEKKRKFEQDGRSVYNYAIKSVPEGMRILLRNTGMEAGKLDWFIPHSANLRMIKSICKKLDFSFDKTLTSLEYFGNTSSASIPLALWLAVKENKINKDDTIAFYGFGSGLAHAGLVVKW